MRLESQTGKMKEIPLGFIRQPDGSYSKQSKRRVVQRLEPSAYNRQDAGPNPAATTNPRTNAYAEQFLSACEACGLPTPIPEYQFALPERKYSADFAFVDARIIVEVDGGIFRKGGGAHSHPTNILRDMERTNEATVRGWRLMRFTPEELNKAATFWKIKDAIAWKPA